MVKPILIYDNSKNRIYSIVSYNDIMYKIIARQKINGIYKQIFIKLIPKTESPKCYIYNNLMNSPSKNIPDERFDHLKNVIVMRSVLGRLPRNEALKIINDAKKLSEQISNN